MKAAIDAWFTRTEVFLAFVAVAQLLLGAILLWLAGADRRETDRIIEEMQAEEREMVVNMTTPAPFDFAKVEAEMKRLDKVRPW